MEPNILGKRIKLLRQEARLTQEQFGKPFNLRKSTISQYESGDSRPDDELKKRIALDYNVSLDWLLGLTNIRNYASEKEEPKKLKPEVETIAAHLDDKDITPKKMKMIQDYIDLLFDDEE